MRLPDKELEKTVPFEDFVAIDNRLSQGEKAAGNEQLQAALKTCEPTLDQYAQTIAFGFRKSIRLAPGVRMHIAVQLARHAGAEVVESGPVDLVFDTRGGEIPAGERVVSIVEEVPGATYFVVEPDHEQLLELGALVDAGDLRPEVGRTRRPRRRDRTASAHKPLHRCRRGRPKARTTESPAVDRPATPTRRA